MFSEKLHFGTIRLEKHAGSHLPDTLPAGMDHLGSGQPDDFNFLLGGFIEIHTIAYNRKYILLDFHP